MTRQDWIDNITTWYELIDFCNEEGYEDYINDIYSEESRDDYLNYSLVEMARQADSWESLLETLNDIPTGYDYYRQDDYGDWVVLDCDYDFRERKDEVLERLDDDEFWDDYEEEEEEPAAENEDPDDLIPVEDEDMDVSELFTACNSTLQKLDSETDNNEDDPLDDFCSKLAVSVEVQVEIKEGGNS